MDKLQYFATFYDFHKHYCRKSRRIAAIQEDEIHESVGK